MRPLLLVSVALLAVAPLMAQVAQPAAARLPREALDVVPPPAHVRGTPGTMVVRPQQCPVIPTAQARRRIVDVAAQEWAFFGFQVVDQSELVRVEASDAADATPQGPPRGRRRPPRLDAEEAARVASTVAGYWAVTSEGSWIVERQNDAWKGPDGIGARWNAPWSAAFISWVMCASGLGSTPQFERAIAHYTYIDQAIRARDGRAPQAAYVAYDAGEATIAPGDLLCSSRRPAYRTIAERRRQAGVGARSHCDVVVKVDEGRGTILTIGGNVRAAVSLKVFPAARTGSGPLRVVLPGTNARPLFAHLKLRADETAPNALDLSPIVKATGCDVSALSGPGRAAVLSGSRQSRSRSLRC